MDQQFGRKPVLSEHFQALCAQCICQALECGIFAHGIVRARGDDFGHGYFFVAFSCKGRVVCPSCNARCMVDTAAHLTDHLIVRLPERHWVLAVLECLRFFRQRDGPGPDAWLGDQFSVNHACQVDVNPAGLLGDRNRVTYLAEVGATACV